MTGFIIPTDEGFEELEEALNANAAAGKWALIAPDGRAWFNSDLTTLFAVIASEMQGIPNRFGEH